MPKNDEIVILEEGTEVQQTKAYGIGVDCHSQFIQISVFVKNNMKFFEYRRESATDWESLVRAKSWVLGVISKFSSPVPDMSSENFHYCIESTSTYHMPVILAWEGTPSVVNPSLAGATKKKSDILDAKLLALHDLTGIWRESYIPASDVKELRIMISERNRYVREATSSANRINNIITSFGLTIGREGSVVKNSEIRAIIENQVSECPLPIDGLCPQPIPHEVRRIIREEYAKHDHAAECAERLMNRIRDKALSMEWETADGVLPGTDMIRILTSAPQIGEVTAITWLAHIITPRRFPNKRALAAYCGLDPSLKTSAGHVTSGKKRGGCKEIHKALTSAGDRLIRNHNEMFGRWGYMIYQQTGKWKKASSAVGRKLSTALYFMMLTGREFSYEKYNLVKSIDVFDFPVSELPSLNPDFKRYVHILKENGIHTTSEMATQYLSCKLVMIKGLGRKFFTTVREFLSSQHKYKKLYKQLHEGGPAYEP